MLYIVPTPIGNLQDITLRAQEVLKTADFILCEDTRHTQKLLSSLGVSARAVRYNENDFNSLKHSLSLLKAGKTCALVSDAGTPCVSDPGYKLVAAARKEGIKICALPGPSALTCALSASGLSGGGFCFLGFLPQKKGKALSLTRSALAVGKPVVIYESPYRIIKLLELFCQTFGPSMKIVLARELTKTFEEYLCASLGEVLANLKARKKILGEFVLILDGREDIEELAQNPAEEPREDYK